MLISGEMTPRCRRIRGLFRQGHPNVARLFSDYLTSDKYVKDTGIIRSCMWWC